MKVGIMLKKLRIDLNLTQSQLSEKVGMSRSHLSDIENGRTGTTFETVEKILNEVNYNIYRLYKEYYEEE